LTKGLGNVIHLLHSDVLSSKCDKGGIGMKSLEDMRVLLTFPISFQPYVQELRRFLLENSCLPTFRFFDSPPSKKEQIDWVKEVDIYVSGNVEKVDGEIIKSASNLRAIIRFGVGYDNVDLGVAREKKIYVTNIPGKNADSVAELTMGLIFALARRIPYLHILISQGNWQLFVGRELKGKVLGIVGLGAVAKCVVKKVQGLEMKILGYDTFWDEDFAKKWQIEKLTLEDLLRKADFVTLHLPLNKETKNLISYKQLSLMKNEAYLINTSRGGIVNEEALVEALKSRRIAGAALDVFSVEPLTRPKLQQLDNVVLTPHIGGTTEESIRRVIEEVVTNILRVQKGEKPLNIVNGL